MTPPIFTQSTFDLLSAIALTPTAGFYHDHRAEFKAYVEQPLQGLLGRAALRLPVMMRERLETRRNVFSRILKNDFGRGGAWANYWGAFYPKGSRRLADVQLAVWMDARRVQISFYIGDYAVLPRERFLRNLRACREHMPGLLRDLIDNPRVLISRGETVFHPDGSVSAKDPLTWAEWLDDPAAGGYWVRLALSPRQALALPGDALEALVRQMHTAYFPLALLAMEENPLPVIEAFVGKDGAYDVA